MVIQIISEVSVQMPSGCDDEEWGQGGKIELDMKDV